MSGEWYVEVRANELSVLDLELLSPDDRLTSVDPSWVSTPTDNRLAVTSRDWLGDLDAADVRKMAWPIVEKLSAHLTSDSPLHAPLELGVWVWRRDPDAPLGYRRSGFLELVEMAMATSIFSAKVLINGYEVAPPRTVGQRQKEFSVSNPDFAAAVSLFSQAGEDLVKLHIVLEYVRKRSGHDPAKFASKAEIAAFSETANNRPHVRHIGGERPNAHAEVSGQEGRKLLRRLLVGWLEAELRF